MKYEKVHLSTDNQLLLLNKERKLTINEPQRAKEYLDNIGYFRLAGYMFHLQVKDGSQRFKEGTDFNHIIRHYKFDQHLRTIFLTYLERIEIKLRASLTNAYSDKYGFFWYKNLDLYARHDIRDSTCEAIKKNFDHGKEKFQKSFKLKYPEEDYPPSNMALENLTFGKLVKLYKGLKNGKEKMTIARAFNLPSSILTSWLIYLSNVRNVCAHFGRLWNRKLTANQPVIPSRKKYKFNGELPKNFNTTVFGMISMINRLLYPFNPDNRFLERTLNLIEEYSDVIDVKYMGFSENWKSEPPWK